MSHKNRHRSGPKHKSRGDRLRDIPAEPRHDRAGQAVLKRRQFLIGGTLGGAGMVLGCGENRTPGLPPTTIENLSTPQTEGSSDLLIERVSVFDSTTGAHRPNMSVLVRDGVLESVVPAGESSLESAAATIPRIDASGMFLLPGFIDAHVHLSHILYQSRMTGDEVLPFYLGHGVTAIRSTGDNVPAQALVQRLANDNPETSPRVFTCSFLIDGSPPWHPDVGWALTSPEEVAPFVAHMARWDVTTLKIYVGTGREIGRRVIEEGHKHDLVISGHLLNYPVGEAVEDGLDVIEHIYTVSNFLLDDEGDRHSINLDSDRAKRLIDTIAEHRTWVDPTLIVFWGTLLFMDVPDVYNHPDNVGMPERLRRFWREDGERRKLDWGAAPLGLREQTWEQYMRLTGMLHDAGVPLLVGTDAPEPQVAPGASLHHEMEFMVEAGVPTATVLRAATLENARVLRQEDRLGRIEPGFEADMVLLEHDPLVDIKNTRTIRTVVRAGRAYDPGHILATAPTV